jgi:hypothetical protein
MNMTEVARATVLVRPLRFTDHLPAMQEFLACLGYSTRTSRDHRWATMVGESGEVALHDAAISAGHAPPGKTDLIFEVDQAEPLAAQFTAAGFEAWGRVLVVTDGETGLYFDVRPDDLYGYRVEDPRPSHGVTSMPVLYGPPTGPLDALLSAAGLVRLDEGDDEWWRVWSASGGGLVARHPAGGGVAPGAVRLAFRTQEPLAELARRLTVGGYAGVTLAEDSGELTVTDPDGQRVLVQAAMEDRT